MNTRPEIPAFLIAALALIGVVVLTALGDPVPDILNVVTVGALTAAGAITQVPRPPAA